ncbi:MAG: hypothetical protein LBJ67_06930 [Planctomycetaceae bacterium]|nr:hypothetical protein [Planctomycetaceae bacterium]
MSKINLRRYSYHGIATDSSPLLVPIAPQTPRGEAEDVQPLNVSTVPSPTFIPYAGNIL